MKKRLAFYSTLGNPCDPYQMNLTARRPTPPQTYLLAPRPRLVFSHRTPYRHWSIVSHRRMTVSLFEPPQKQFVPLRSALGTARTASFGHLLTSQSSIVCAHPRVFQSTTSLCQYPPINGYLSSSSRMRRAPSRVFRYHMRTVNGTSRPAADLNAKFETCSESIFLNTETCGEFLRTTDLRGIPSEKTFRLPDFTNLFTTMQKVA